MLNQGAAKGTEEVGFWGRGFPSLRKFFIFDREMVHFGEFLYADFDDMAYCFVVYLKQVFK